VHYIEGEAIKSNREIKLQLITAAATKMGETRKYQLLTSSEANIYICVYTESSDILTKATC
jgi:hypothetical protein